MAETAPEAVAEDKDSINGIQQLSQEATIINQSFSQQARRWALTATAAVYPPVLPQHGYGARLHATMGPF